MIIIGKLNDTKVTGTLDVTGNISSDGNVTDTNISTMKNEINGLNSNLSNVLQKIKNFITVGVEGNSSATLTKPAQYNLILIAFRGTGVDLFTIDKWNNIGQISGDQTSGMSISCTNSGSTSASTVTLTNTISTFRLIWGVCFYV